MSDTMPCISSAAHIVNEKGKGEKHLYSNIFNIKAYITKSSLVTLPIIVVWGQDSLLQ